MEAIWTRYHFIIRNRRNRRWLVTINGHFFQNAWSAACILLESEAGLPAFSGLTCEQYTAHAVNTSALNRRTFCECVVRDGVAVTQGAAVQELEPGPRVRIPELLSSTLSKGIEHPLWGAKAPSVHN